MFALLQRAARSTRWLALLGCCFAGCGTQNLATLEAENKRLSEQSQAQLAEIENLKVHSRKIEDQLLDSEQRLATLDARGAVANRSPAGRSGAPLAGGAARGPGHAQLAELASKLSYLHYDPQTGIAKVDTDILFDSGEADLKPAGVQLLRDLTSVLKSSAGQDLKVMVVGHTDDQQIKSAETRDRYPNNWHLSTARANVVADEFRTLGLSGERMGVAGFGQFQSIAKNDSPQTRQQNRRVEIFLTAPDVPIVGMTETLTNLY